jgi:hypothetical protein
MRSLLPTLLRPLFAALVLVLVLVQGPFAAAQTLYVGGLDTLFLQGDPVAGNFQFLGGCGGSIQSMAESYQDLYLGDVGGRVYVYHGRPGDPLLGSTHYVFDSLNDATALVDYGGTLLVGGSDGTVHRIDKRDGSVERTYTVGVPVGAMLLVEGTLYVGSPTLDVIQVDLATGSATLLGTCGGEIHSMARDGAHLVLGTPQGIVYRMQLASGLVDAGFVVPNDATAMLMHTGDLLLGGSDSSILRLDPADGTLLATLASPGSDVSALAFGADVPAPGFPYCHGLDCPCGNDDVLAGCANSLGRGARMQGAGTSSFTSDDLVLTVDQLPQGAWAVNYMGALANDVPFGDGKLCAGNGYPLFRFPIKNSGPTGTITLGPGIVAYSQQQFGALGEITSGSTWLFQIWYRNPSGPCGAGFNTSNGYGVSFGL